MPGKVKNVKNKILIFMRRNHIMGTLVEHFLFRNPVKVVDENGKLHDTFVITTEEKKVAFIVKLQLPANLVCSHCVLQWTYIAGQFLNEVLLIYTHTHSDMFSQSF